MTKKIAILAVLLYIAGTISGQEFTFRGLPWGSSVEDIIAKEGQPDFNDDGYLSDRDVTISGYKARLSFYCWPSVHRLYMGRYEIKNNDDPRNIYNALLDKLSLLYGQPVRETNTLKIEYEYYWLVSKTKIRLRLFGSSIDITYEAPEINEYGGL
jgi:hypothetical protein